MSFCFASLEKILEKILIADFDRLKIKKKLTSKLYSEHPKSYKVTSDCRFAFPSLEKIKILEKILIANFDRSKIKNLPRK